jgi:hypothetical protein
MSLFSFSNKLNLKPAHLMGLVLLGVVFLIALFSFWFSMSRNKVVAPGNERSSDSRNTVGCDAFDVTEAEIKKFPSMQRLKLNDTGSIPDDFPMIPVKTTLCGSLEQLDSVFFITELRDEDLLNYYRIELLKKGYEVGEPKSGTEASDKVLEVRSSNGFGSIYSFGDKKAYAISFTTYSGSN